MTDRDRLIEITEKSFAEQYEKRGLLTAPNTVDDLLANGVIVPPCKVGDTVYIIQNGDMLDIEPSVCSIVEDETYEMSFGKTQSGELKWLYLVLDTGEDFYDTEIGKTVFLTKEEAEARLKELSNGTT